MTKSQSIGLRAETDTQIRGAAFPATQWSKHFALRAGVSSERRTILDFLIRRYWKPVYCYCRRAGCSEEDAKDLVQEFFSDCLRRDLFARADAGQGRFRNLLLKSLQHFLANARRAALAKKRHPSKGFAFIDETAFQEENPGALKHTETPDEIFHRTWLVELVQRVLKRLEQACREAGQETHYTLFRRYVVGPALDGSDAPHLRELGAACGLTAKDAANRVLTVQRAFQRLLADEIRLYAASEEEIAGELRELKRFLAR